ncbi:MAG: hypothetical protein NXH97_11035 [Rhodobacteraceae bacterium]|nr:hypothetical protein [Paracoccaceae bacterium]
MRHVLGLTAALFAAGGAQAQDSWEFRLTPYVWAPSFDASTRLPDGGDGSTSGSLLDYLAGAFLITGEARYGPWSVFGDYNYVNLSEGLNPPASLVFRRLRLEGSFGTVAAGYALRNTGDTRLEAFAGARIWDVEARLEGPLIEPSSTLDFTDPIIGLRGETRLGEKWGIRGTVDIGGFGLADSSDFQTEIIGAASYDFSDRVAGVLGYRYLHVDLQDDPGTSIRDITFSGPFVALDFRF